MRSTEALLAENDLVKTQEDAKQILHTINGLIIKIVDLNDWDKMVIDLFVLLGEVHGSE